MTSTSNTTKRSIITLWGNAGSDPEEIHFPAKTKEVVVYDPVIDDQVTKIYETPASHAHRFSLAVNDRKNPNVPTRWFSVFDRDNLSQRLLVRRGDWLKLRGYIEERVSKDASGEVKVFRNFRLLDLQVMGRKVRQQAA